MASVEINGNKQTMATKNSIVDKTVKRKWPPVADDIPMQGFAGYVKSWSVVQTSVNKLKKELTVPVPVAALYKREFRHLPKRRIDVNMYRDLQIMKVIKKTQKFQLRYEKSSIKAPTRQAIDDTPLPRSERPRKHKHYDYSPVFEQLPPQNKPIEGIEEERVYDITEPCGFDILSESLEYATECKEGDIYNPSPLCNEIEKELEDLFTNSTPSMKDRFHKFVHRQRTIVTAALF